MSGMVHYKKRRVVQQNNKCTTFSYIDENGKVIEKDKVKYSSDTEAILKARRFNAMDKTIHKMVAYKCKTCGYWHIGKTDAILTDKDRMRYKSLLNN